MLTQQLYHITEYSISGDMVDKVIPGNYCTNLFVPIYLLFMFFQ